MTQQHLTLIENAVAEQNNRLNVLNRLQLTGTNEYDETMSELISLESCLHDMKAIMGL